MARQSWDETYRNASLDLRPPDPLLVQYAAALSPGRALDLACGTGRNSVWLAQRGWNVTSVDISPVAIETLAAHAARQGAVIDARIVDLEAEREADPKSDGFTIGLRQWDLIVACYYLQRNLFERAKAGLVPGGVFVAIALMFEPGKEHSPFRLQPGELRGFFEGWEILHDAENVDASHRAVAQIVARRPA